MNNKIIKNMQIELRVLNHARLFLERDATVRSVAAKTKWGRQTVHLDLAKRLKEINLELFDKVSKKLKENQEIGRIKGGIKTQEKWLKKSNI